MEDSEEEQVEACLRRDPEYRRQWRRLRRQVRRIETAAPDDLQPPPGLAERTCEMIFSQPRPMPGDCPDFRAPTGHRGADVVGVRTKMGLSPSSDTPRPAMTPQAAPAGGTGRMRWLDMGVAAAVCLAAGLLILPAVQSSRFHARLVACQDNLRQLGGSLTDYSQRHSNYFPQVPAKGKLAAAGIYAPILLTGGYLTEPRRVVCPDSNVAIESEFRVPLLRELQTARDDEAARWRRQMGGSYGYGLGYVDHGVFQPTRDLQRATFAVMADAPSDLPGRQTRNHSGRGQNVLFEDGHVVFMTCSRLAGQSDDIFANDHDLVAAGLHRDDAVIAPSAAGPMLAEEER